MIEAGPNQTLVAGSKANINTTSKNVDKYLWDHSETLNCDTCASPVASMSVTTTYHVDVSTNFGCKGSDSITIYLFCDQSQVFIPNSFTPNKDGQNDVFYLRGSGISTIKSFRIYNRWGQLVFESHSLQDGWDGVFKGKPQDMDVYTWTLDATFHSGAIVQRSGNLTLLR